MGKTLSPKSGYNIADIINRSDIGTLTDNGDGTIDAVNAKTADVEKVLGASTYSVGELCVHSAVNMWALYKPGYIDIGVSENLILINPSSNRNLGDFLGYNHDAAAPEVADTNFSYNGSTTSLTIMVLFDQQEVNWDEIPNVDFFWTVIRNNDGSIRKEKRFQIDYSTRSQNLDVDIDVSNESEDLDLTTEVWVGNYGGKLALVDSGVTTVNYLGDPTYFAGAGYDMSLDLSEIQHQNESIDAAANTFYIQVKLIDSNGDTWYGYVDIDVIVNGSKQTTITNKQLNGDSGNGFSPISGNFPGGITEYGDTWSLMFSSSS